MEKRKFKKIRYAFGITVLALFPGLIAAIIVGAIYVSYFYDYEYTSHRGTLIATEVSTNYGKSVSFSVDQIFSYTTSLNGVEESANCTRDAYRFSTESAAVRAANKVVLGTTRTIYLSRVPYDDRCIDKKTREYYRAVGFSMIIFIGVWTIMTVAVSLCFCKCCKSYFVTGTTPSLASVSPSEEDTISDIGTVSEIEDKEDEENPIDKKVRFTIDGLVQSEAEEAREAKVISHIGAILV